MDSKKLKNLIIGLAAVDAILVIALFVCLTSASAETSNIPQEEAHETVIYDITYDPEEFYIYEPEPVIEEESRPQEEEIVEEVTYEEPVYYDYAPTQTYYQENGSGLTKSGGVNYHEGRTETYYSSNVLYHKDTASWTLGDDGVYRDSEGYVVVSASDVPMGSTVSTSLGEGKVYDTGCANGITDIYTNW